ncbi:hypothetical protein E8L90_07330 [Brevibacillus antibioticus]|uniref:TnsA endonuclease C-terminal domain-containing protein n=1 Tax=Brevibacillus antibioticus TaxID=2570228 RepID=A0A4U2Y552_9BACL|nr:hypothetical protein E8L90_07330 [Brevibacillus antibioticus]
MKAKTKKQIINEWAKYCVLSYLLEYRTTTNYRTLTEALSGFERYYGLERGEAFTVFKHLAASKKVQFVCQPSSPRVSKSQISP